VTSANTCACGKVGWSNERKAKDALVRAKIAFALYGNRRRREQRAYECPIRRGTWHLTSQPERLRDRTLAPLSYPVHDVEAARDYIAGVIVENNAAAWNLLLAPERAEQTLRALGLMHQAVLRERGRRRDDPEGQANYQEWLKVARPLGDVLVSKIRVAQQAVKRANVIESQGQLQRDALYLRRMVRRLAVAIHEHEQVAGGEADRRLCALLDELRMPRSTKSLRDLIENGSWDWGAHEASLDGTVPVPPLPLGAEKLFT
jgi:hypothetical protein